MRAAYRSTIIRLLAFDCLVGAASLAFDQLLGERVAGVLCALGLQPVMTSRLHISLGFGQDSPFLSHVLYAAGFVRAAFVVAAGIFVVQLVAVRIYLGLRGIRKGRGTITLLRAMVRAHSLGGFLLFCIAWSVMQLHTPLALLGLLLFLVHVVVVTWCMLNRKRVRLSELGLICAACGYSLRGNTSGICPECGGAAALHPR